MKNLNFGCRRSDFLITNSNDDWFIQCRFYEPYQKSPFTYRRRFNKFKTEKERKQVEKMLLKQMSELLDEKDYNPRTKQFMFENGEMNQMLSMKDALQLAFEGKEYTREHNNTVKNYLKKFNEIATRLSLDYLKIKDIELIHIKKILENCGISNYSYNKYKKALSSLFTDLVDAGCLKVNPCTGIKSKVHVAQIKVLFTDMELDEIEKKILLEHQFFYNFYQIFSVSGCRVSEIVALKYEDIDIERQEFTITLKKGSMYIREKRAIIQDAVFFWKSQIRKCKKGQFLFSTKYQPGDKPLNRDYIYKWWKKNIGIKTIYTRKHTFLDKIEEANYNAQIMAGHRDDRTTSIYTVGREKRRLEAQKKITLNKRPQ